MKHIPKRVIHVYDKIKVNYYFYQCNKTKL